MVAKNFDALAEIEKRENASKKYKLPLDKEELKWGIIPT